MKSDRVGRTRYTKSYKAKVVTAYEQSGMSVAGFAEHYGIKHPTFASWISKTPHCDFQALDDFLDVVPLQSDELRLAKPTGKPN